MNLSHDAMLVGLRIAAWSGRQYDRKASTHVAVHHDASVSAGRYNKCLLPKAAFAALTATMSAARSAHYAQTLPWDDQGSRLLTVANYERYTELMDALRERMVRERARFIEDYDDNIDKARLDLGKLFRIEDYPSKEALRGKFGLRYRIIPVPDADHFMAKLASDDTDRVKRDIESQIEERLHDAVGDLYRRLGEAVERVSERLQEDDEGKPLVFRDSMIGKPIVKEIDMTTIENIETTAQSVTATICENAALFGAAPERDEFDIDLDSVIVADSGNPIADLAALGHGLLNAALAAIAALMGAATGSGLLESIPFIGKGLDVFESAWQVSDALVSTLLGLLIIAGAVLAYVLPALPFIRFLFGILGWILNVAIAVLAVTVFAAAHVTREDGNRLTTQATRQGWLFLPALVLRPALMLLGLILGYFVFLAGIGLFNEVWLPQMRDAGASGGLGPVGFLAMLALYVIIAYGLMNASFKLIDLLPSAVLDWIGGRAGAGDDGSERTGGAAVGGISRLGAVRIGARSRRGGAGS